MLGRILVAIREAGGPMCLADLSRELEIDEAALEGMLDTLMARGRLHAIESTEAFCGGCPIKSGCFIMNDGVARTYALVMVPAAGPLKVRLRGSAAVAGGMSVAR